MHAILVILAAVSLDVTASRQVTVPRSIERTCLRVAAGFASSMADGDNLTRLCKVFEDSNASIEIRDARLLVNGQRDGSAVRRSASGLAKIGLFVSHLSRSSDAVELRYTLECQGLSIRRSITITQGQIVSRAAFPCAMGPQGRVRHVWLSYVARESPAGTTITSAATVTVNTGICPSRSTSRLKVVNRLAGRAAAEQIDAALREAEREARQLSADGHEAIVGHVTNTLNYLLRWKR